LKSWHHRTAIGRDQYQRLVKLGRLYPFGHEAILTSTTERILTTSGSGARAGLVSRPIITVREPFLPFGGDDAIGRQFPFGSIELLTTATPMGTLETLHGDAQYVVTGKGPFHYRCLATDRAGRPVRFELPLIFVPEGFTDFAGLASAYAGRADLSNLTLDAQTITVTTPAPAGQSLLATPRPPDATDVMADFANLKVAGGSAFRPVLSEITGRVPAVERFAGSTAPLKLRYYTDYISKGFGAGNLGEVVLEVTGVTPVLGLVDTAANGGLMSALSFGVTGLSRLAGPVGGSLGEIAANRFNAKQWLGSALDNMALLGVVPLKDLISDVSQTLADAPTITQDIIDGLRTQVFRWTVPLFRKQKTIDLGVARVSAIDQLESQMVIEAIVTPHDDGSMTSRTACTVSNILLGLGLGSADLVTVPFEKIAFTSVDARKPDCDVMMGRISFHGVLAFVGVLADLVDKSGFSDPPALDVTANSVRSSFSAPIPNVAVGVFSLENISFGASFELFFDGRAPELALNFATFDNPFRLTVSALGGGGYLGLNLSAKSGLQRLEGSLEFGAALSVNLVVAKGSVSAMGGIYFLIEAGSAQLTGYLRIEGQLSVLGLISVAVAMLMAMTYDNGVVRGKAEVLVKVKVLFFKKTARITFERSFAGSNADPSFAELMDPADAPGPRPWDTYCLAYA
jgi:hypothetical protein